jgi:hypothetical protein
LYAAFSNDAFFDDPTTPQAQALDWITNEDTLTVCPSDNSCHPLQRYVLAVFYFATNGGAWDQCNAPSDFNDAAAIEEANNNCDRVVTPFAVPNQRVGDSSSDAWLSPSNECEWGGVACWGADTPNLNLCVDQLDFENDGLAGTLVDELGALDSLRFLILEQGDLTGSIPTTYGLLERLLILDLDFNNMAGQLPDEIYGLSSLQQLDLNDNFFTGTISPLIGQLSLLTFFQIDHNEITGVIPTEMGELEQLSKSPSSFELWVIIQCISLMSCALTIFSFYFGQELHSSVTQICRVQCQMKSVRTVTTQTLLETWVYWSAARIWRIDTRTIKAANNDNTTIPTMPRRSRGESPVI